MDVAFPPFHVAAVNLADVAGFKVHLDEAPGDAELLGLLEGAQVPPPDLIQALAVRWEGDRQILLTWRDAVNAQRATLTLDRLPSASGRRISAKFWTPAGYNPQADDKRRAPLSAAH